MTSTVEGLNIETLPELSRAIAAEHQLPAAVGWDDVIAD